MKAYELDDLFSLAAQQEAPYLEFLKVPDLSMGLYQLPAGGTDPQNPHTEDEVYYLLEGRAQIRVGDEVRPMRAGSIVYVAAQVPHKFIEIEEELKILVFFAPAETA